MIERSKQVVIDSLTHTYTHLETGLNLRSVSKVYGEFIEPFDSERISWMVARKGLRLELDPMWSKGGPEPSEAAILERQSIILGEWDDKARNASEYGTEIHSICENIMNDVQVDDKHHQLKMLLNAEYAHYHKKFPELIVHSLKWGVAGTVDNPLIRQRSDKSVIDIDDFKTNIEKGIVFDSIKLLENHKLKHYNRFMLDPVEHLESCNYNHYAIQLSMYAVLIQDMFPTHKIGRLTLTFIKRSDNDNSRFTYEIERIPIPYLKHEAIAILNAYNKKYPFKRKVKVKKIEEAFDPDDF